MDAQLPSERPLPVLLGIAPTGGIDTCGWSRRYVSFHGSRLILSQCCECDDAEVVDLSASMNLGKPEASKHHFDGRPVLSVDIMCTCFIEQREEKEQHRTFGDSFVASGNRRGKDLDDFEFNDVASAQSESCSSSCSEFGSDDEDAHEDKTCKVKRTHGRYVLRKREESVRKLAFDMTEHFEEFSHRFALATQEAASLQQEEDAHGDASAFKFYWILFDVHSQCDMVLGSVDASLQRQDVECRGYIRMTAVGGKEPFTMRLGARDRLRNSLKGYSAVSSLHDSGVAAQGNNRRPQELRLCRLPWSCSFDLVQFEVPFPDVHDLPLTLKVSAWKAEGGGGVIGIQAMKLQDVPDGIDCATVSMPIPTGWKLIGHRHGDAHVLPGFVRWDLHRLPAGNVAALLVGGQQGAGHLSSDFGVSVKFKFPDTSEIAQATQAVCLQGSACSAQPYKAFRKFVKQGFRAESIGSAYIQLSLDQSADDLASLWTVGSSMGGSALSVLAACCPTVQSTSSPSLNYKRLLALLVTYRMRRPDTYPFGLPMMLWPRVLEFARPSHKHIGSGSWELDYVQTQLRSWGLVKWTYCDEWLNADQILGIGQSKIIFKPQSPEASAIDHAWKAHRDSGQTKEEVAALKVGCRCITIHFANGVRCGQIVSVAGSSVKAFLGYWQFGHNLTSWEVDMSAVISDMYLDPEYSSPNQRLWHAAASANIAAVRAALQDGAQLAACANPVFGYDTPLHALARSPESMLKMFKSRSDFASTSEFLALEEQVAPDRALARMLVAANADLSAMNAVGSTALHACVEKKRVALAAVFVELGVDVNAQDSEGMTALDRARGLPATGVFKANGLLIKSSEEELVELLESCGQRY